MGRVVKTPQLDVDLLYLTSVICFIEACTPELYTRYTVHPCRVHPTFGAYNLCFSFLVRPCDLNGVRATITFIFVQRHSFLLWYMVPHAGDRGAETSDDG